MALSPVNFNLSNSELFRNIATPLTNRAAISMGAFRIPSPDPLTITNTAYGTNANPVLAGNTFISSADVLEKLYQMNLAQLQLDELEENDKVNNETIEEIDKALELEQINDLTETETTDTLEEVINNNINTSFETYNSNKTNALSSKSNPVDFDFNIYKSTGNQLNPFSAFDNPISITGSHANISLENVKNLAAVNANFNVTFSQEGNLALKELQNNATQNKYTNQDITKLVDGMIPVSAATLSDFTTPQNYNATKPGPLDRIIQAMTKLTNNRSYGDDYS